MKPTRLRSTYTSISEDIRNLAHSMGISPAEAAERIQAKRLGTVDALAHVLRLSPADAERRMSLGRKPQPEQIAGVHHNISPAEAEQRLKTTGGTYDPHSPVWQDKKKKDDWW